ncbi:MAG: flagellar biosynthetic protein FliR [Thermoguttaceae bacterium]
MDWLAQLNVDKFVIFTLVLTRVSGLAMTAPVYGDKQVPMQMRALLALALALLITPSQWNVMLPYPGNTLNYLCLVGGELLVGACLGLGVKIIFYGMELAGEIIGYVGGLMLADIYDPSSDINSPIISKLFSLICLGLFLCIGGHRLVMAGLLDTFRAIPLGNAVFSSSITEAFVTLTTQSYSLAIRAAAPAVVALLLSTLILGLISRTVPQLNVLLIGFGFNAILIFGVLALTLGATAWTFQGQIEPALEHLLDALHTPLNAQWFS